MSSSSRATWLAIVMLAATAAGLYLVLRGFQAMPGVYELPWATGSLRQLLSLLAGILVALALCRRLSRLSIVGSTALVALAVLALLGALWPVVVVGTMALAFTLVGRRLRAWWRDRGAAHDDPLIDLALGAGLYGTVVSVLVHFPVSRTALYVLLIGAPIVLGRRDALTLLRAIVERLRPTVLPTPFPAWGAATLAIAYLVVALFPETGWDALAMHLFIPAHVAAQASWSFDPHRFSWALMPALGDWLFTIAYVFDGERGARVLNAACTILVAAFTHRIAVACGARSAWAWFAGALVLATPVVFAVSASLFIDAEWTLFVLAALLVFLRASVPGQPPYAWITGGALLGFSAATKAVTLPLLPVFAVLVVVQWQAWRVPGGTRVLLWLVCAFAVAAAKPYLYAWLATGNPVYPFFMHVFGGTPAFDIWTTGPQTFKQPLSLATPYDATFAADRYVEGRTGSPGFQWLIMLPAAVLALLLTRHRRGLLLVGLALAMLAAVFAFQGYLRYLLPALALLIAAFAIAGTALRDARWASGILALGGAATVALNVAHLNAASRRDEFRLSILVDERKLRDHVLLVSPVRRATELAVQLPAAGTRLAFFSTPAFAVASNADVLHPSWYTPSFGRAVGAATSPEALARVLLDWRVRYVVVDGWWLQPQPPRHVLGATRPVAEFVGASVREVRREFLFEHEYLRNPDLASIDGWTLAGGARHDAAQQALVVTAESPAYQSIPVEPGTVFANKVRARCAGAGIARTQINWHDARNAYLSTSAQTFPCGGAWNEQEQEVITPPGARFALVYATSADTRPVEIDSVSLRGRRP